MKDAKDGGSHIASIHNESALFAGDADSGDKYFYQYEDSRPLSEIAADILKIEQK